MTAPRDERAEREREVARVHDEAVDDVKHLARPGYRISRWRETEELPRQWTLAFADRLLATSRARLERVVEGLRNGVGENASERFDDLAHRCFMATGVLPPGKDDPLASHSFEERAEVWRNWKRINAETCNAVLTAMQGEG